MKKIFSICSVIFIICSTSKAEILPCSKQGLDWNWVWLGNKTSIEFKFKNTVNKHFWIDGLELLTSSNEVVVSENTMIHIPPFGTKNTYEPVGLRGQERIGLTNINTDVIKKGRIYCQSLVESEINKLKKIKIKTSSSEKGSFELEWWLKLPLLILVFGFLFALFDKNKKTNAKSKKKTDKVFYSEKYGWSAPGKYILLSLPAIAGLTYFENGLIKFIFGVYLFGCIIGFFKGDK
tara:strand:- start:60 stop:764 length:705 start_codon:yes stop_codon:yes gene_type:complete